MIIFDREMMKKFKPYWEDGSDWSRKTFFIQRLEMKSPLKATEIPLSSLPLCGFLFLTEGEVLVDIDGVSCMCRRRGVGELIPSIPTTACWGVSAVNAVYSSRRRFLIFRRVRMSRTGGYPLAARKMTREQLINKVRGKYKRK